MPQALGAKQQDQPRRRPSRRVVGWGEEQSRSTTSVMAIKVAKQCARALRAKLRPAVWWADSLRQNTLFWEPRHVDHACSHCCCPLLSYTFCDIYCRFKQQMAGRCSMCVTLIIILSLMTTCVRDCSSGSSTQPYIP